MANQWGGKIIHLDSPSIDTSYNPKNDVKYGGSQYSTLKYKICKIQIIKATSGDRILLRQCTSQNILGTPIIDVTLNANHKEMDFGDGFWVKGINPSYIDGNSEVLVFVK